MNPKNFLHDTIQAIKETFQLEDIDLKGDTKIYSLEEELDNNYVLETLSKLGIDYSRITSGGAISERGREVFKECSRMYKPVSRRYKHVMSFSNPDATPNINALVKKLTVMDLALFKAYSTKAG